jgi:transcriptional regulator with XRE-family HTH domain
MRTDREIRVVLRAARKRAGLKQGELAARLFVDRSTISKVETGDITPSYALVKEWARACHAEDLINLDLTGGANGWRKLLDLESLVRELKEKMDLVKLLKRRKTRTITRESEV